jgi:type IV secretory pathway VirB2 component (pilin)
VIKRLIVYHGLRLLLAIRGRRPGAVRAWLISWSGYALVMLFVGALTYSLLPTPSPSPIAPPPPPPAVHATAPPSPGLLAPAVEFMEGELLMTIAITVIMASGLILIFAGLDMLTVLIPAVVVLLLLLNVAPAVLDLLAAP